MGAQVEDPAPTISMPVFSMTTLDVLSAGEYCVTDECSSPVKTQKSPPHCAKATAARSLTALVRYVTSVAPVVLFRPAMTPEPTLNAKSFVSSPVSSVRP